MRGVRIGSHEVTVVAPVPCCGVVRYTAHCRFCGLCREWRLGERALGTTAEMVADDLARRLLEFAPTGMQCPEVKDWLLVREVMES